MAVFSALDPFLFSPNPKSLRALASLEEEEDGDVVLVAASGLVVVDSVAGAPVDGGATVEMGWLATEDSAELCSWAAPI